MPIFFKKRSEAKAAKREEARQVVLKDFDQKYEDAMQTRDPAERVLKLENQREAIDALVDTSNGKMLTQAKGKWLTTYLGTTIGVNIAIDVVSTVLIGVPASSLLMIPSIIVGWFAGDKRVKNAHEDLVKENAPFFAALTEKKTRAEQGIAKALETDMRDFAESPKFQQALDRVPSLREKFGDAYKKHIIDGGISGPKKKPPGFNP